MDKKCKKCMNIFPRSSFYKKGNGITAMCKDCHNFSRRQYRSDNIDDVRRKERESYEASYRCEKHGDSGKRLYQTWADINRRCKNKSATSYNSYGGRGIKICKDWESYLSFKEWAISSGYNDDLTIERIDVNGNYEPKNCKWITRNSQNYNKRNSRKIEFMGINLTMAEWSAITGITRQGIRYRLSNSWTPEQIILTPRR